VDVFEGQTRVPASVRRRRPAAVFFTAVFFILAYFALFPYPLGTEIVARPAWVAAVPQPDDPAASAALVEQAGGRFQLGGLFGYVSADGSFAHVEKTLYGVALADSGYVNYTRLGTDWILRDRRGERVVSFSGNGYPLLSPDGKRIFVIKSDLSGITELDRNGDVRWERDFTSILISLSVRGSSLLAGLLDGRMVFIDAAGAAAEFRPAGRSRISVVFGAAVTAEGDLAASVSGIDPQVLTVYRRGDAGFAPRFRQVLATDIRRELRVVFSPDGRCLVWEGSGAIGMLDSRSGRTTRLAVHNSLRGLAFPDGMVAALSSDGSSSELVVVRPFVGPVFTSDYAAREGWIGTIDGQLLLGIDGQLLLGIDGRLMRIDMVAM
jgi:hypothetical protein